MDKEGEKKGIEISLSKRSKWLLEIKSKRKDNLLKKSFIRYMKEINRV